MNLSHHHLVLLWKVVNYMPISQGHVGCSLNGEMQGDLCTCISPLVSKARKGQTMSISQGFSRTSYLALESLRRFGRLALPSY